MIIYKSSLQRTPGAEAERTTVGRVRRMERKMNEEKKKDIDKAETAC